MRNPRAWRAAAFTCAASGLLAGGAAFLLPGPSAPDWVRGFLFMYGVTAVIVGLMGMWSGHRAMRAKRALADTGQLLARWRIDAATWRKFVARNAEIERAPGALFNEISIRDPIAAAGVAIVVGREAVEVDGSIHEVPLRGPPEVTQALLVQDAPDYVELQLLYPGGGAGASGVPRGPTRNALRFPVPPAGWQEARGIVAHFNRLTPQKADFFHGKGDGSDPEDLNTCIACGHQTYRYVSRCPQCGGSMQTRRWSRRLGWVLIGCGVILTAMMGTLIWYTAPMLLQPGKSFDGTRFDGGPGMALVVLAIFGAVLAFGVTALGYGVFEVRTGRRDKRVIYAMLGLWTLLLMVAYAL
jgi:hypothetical protein